MAERPDEGPVTDAVGGGPRVALVSTYPPTRCGLATFAASLRRALLPGSGRDVAVVQVVDEPLVEVRPEVVHQLVNGSAWSRAEAVERLDDFDVVIVQHEYGIYGGEAGEEIVPLLRAVRVPTIVVLHTVPADPTAAERDVLERVAAAVDRVVVPSNAARRRLHEVGYRVDPRKLVVIPHGAHDNRTPYVAPAGRRPTILTWGLLGPGKGIEVAVDALARLGDLDPPPRYLIAGQTHPKVLAADGDVYRDTLRGRAEDRGVGAWVEFDDTYRERDALLALVRTADVVLLPYLSRDQISSGVLVDALASARPVVATCFPHAVELLAGGAGALVPHGDADAMARALRAILTVPGTARRMSREAARLADHLLWPSVAARYRSLASELVRVRAAV